MLIFKLMSMLIMSVAITLHPLLRLLFKDNRGMLDERKDSNRAIQVAKDTPHPFITLSSDIYEEIA